MPKRTEPKQLDPAYLESAAVQLNTRIPLYLKVSLDEYLAYMKLPESRRPNDTHDWPTSIAGVVQRALREYLDGRSLAERRGPTRDEFSTLISGIITYREKVTDLLSALVETDPKTLNPNTLMAILSVMAADREMTIEGLRLRDKYKLDEE